MGTERRTPRERGSGGRGARGRAAHDGDGPQTARTRAVRALALVLERGCTLETALGPVHGAGAPLDDAPQSQSQSREEALVRAICFGTLRWLPRLAEVARLMLRKPLDARDPTAHAALLVGLYQLAYMRVPAHAAVSETVATVRALGRPWATGLVNATLRRFSRERDALLARADERPSARQAHPQWMLDAFARAWPHAWPEAVAANNRQAPMTLRVNRRRTQRDAYLDALAGAGMAGRPHELAPDAIELLAPCAVTALPGFADGLVCVQDAAAQLAAGLLAPRAGDRILDACAAPGGKTGHLLEYEPHARVTAVEVDRSRVERLRGTLERLGFLGEDQRPADDPRVEILCADAGEPDRWWDGRAFDRILLDAPCSATGVIRRHPDIKQLRRASDIGPLAIAQGRLLDALWPLLVRGGRLVYATCSMLPEENDAVVGRFAGTRDDARVIAFDAPWGRPTAGGRQILPGDHSMDGFYYALLEKC